MIPKAALRCSFFLLCRLTNLSLHFFLKPLKDKPFRGYNISAREADMFSGFQEETVQFFLDLKFHNSSSFFHEHHETYVQYVQKPFYTLVDELSSTMLTIDSGIEVRPHKCLSRIHRDTRFSKDKSPYRDHLWVLFRRASEPREQSLNYWFEFGPGRLSWGMGFWGENREVMNTFRSRLAADPARFSALLSQMGSRSSNFVLGGSAFKRLTIPESVPGSLERWYRARDLYISRSVPEFSMAFTDRLACELRDDYMFLSPLYRYFRNLMDRGTDEHPVDPV